MPDQKDRNHPRHVFFAEEKPHPEVDEARHLLRSGQVDEAVALLEPLTQDDCDDCLLFEVLGIAYAYQGRSEASIGAFETAVHLNPAQPQTHYNLGQAMLRAGDIEGARAALSQSLRVDATYIKARDALASLPAAKHSSDEESAAHTLLVE